MTRLLIPVWLLAAAVVAGGPVAIGQGGSPELFKFDGGAEVRGRVVKETPETVFVDLGYTVIAIAKKHVRERVRLAAQAAEKAVKKSIFFTRHLPRAPIKALARQFGEAVVMVKTPSGQGSGFIVDDEDGYAVTNFHVVEGETKISVTVFRHTGTEIRNVVVKDVKIIALSPFLDLALLKLDHPPAGGLRKTYLGSIERLARGDTVFTLGNPMGLSRSVTEGIVSTRHREMGGKVLIQTTAAINPGNSGGPLFNDRGEVVGVTSSKLVGWSVEGIGFAIPVNYVKDFLLNREAFAYDKDNPGSGIRYFTPPRKSRNRSKAEREGRG